MTQIVKRALEDNAVNGEKLRLDYQQSLRSRNSTDDGDVDVLRVTTGNKIEILTEIEYAGSPLAVQQYVDNAVAGLVSVSEIGSAGGICPLDADSKVPAAYLPSYVDDVLEYADFASFPVAGETSIIYVDLATNETYRWSGSAYISIGGGIEDTDDLAEGATNLYFTDSRAKTAAVVNSTAGSETDQAPSVSAMKAYVAANGSATVDTYTYSLLAGDITNGYFVVPAEIDVCLGVYPKGYPRQVIVEDYTFTVTGVDETRITFFGDMLELVAGDKVTVVYSY
jgi:hypothetical protein